MLSFVNANCRVILRDAVSSVLTSLALNTGYSTSAVVEVIVFNSNVRSVI
nr:MAG TPA: hypothetical protein [Caudoviricetes sp.]